MAAPNNSKRPIASVSVNGATKNNDFTKDLINESELYLKFIDMDYPYTNDSEPEDDYDFAFWA